MKKLLTTLFILLSLITLSINFAGGTGTIDDPYLISSAEQLDNIRNYMDKHFKQINDIDLSTYDNWEPIGTYHTSLGIGRGFYGTYDGNGYKISNLIIYKPNEDSVGLFGFIQTRLIPNNLSIGEVKNITIKNAKVNGNNYVGILSGINQGKIKNCMVEGEVTGNFYIGGLLGFNQELFNRRSEVLESKSYVKITGKERVGGIAGGNSGIIYKSFSRGSIEGAYLIGGITGINQGMITETFSEGHVRGEVYIGGIAGINFSEVKNSYSKGEVSGKTFVGGIIGLNNQDQYFVGKVINSYSISNVVGGIYTNALIGKDEGKYDSIYFDYYKSGKSDYIFAMKEEHEMKQKATFIGWDFENVWGIEEDKSYPFLLWEKMNNQIILNFNYFQ